MGSLIWSISAALGLGAIMLANAWVFEIIRYFGAAYLMYLAYKSARSAFSSKAMTRLYLRLRRLFEGAFTIGFGAAGFKILTVRIQS